MNPRNPFRMRTGILRAVLTAVSILLQMLWLLLIILELNNYSTYIALGSSILSSILVIRLASRHTTGAYKIPWIILIMTFPVMGLSLYLLTELAATPRRAHKRIRKARERMEPWLEQDGKILEELTDLDRSAANQFRYLQDFGGNPVFRDTDVQYYSEAADAFRQLKQDLEQAEQFIFMEYFILEEGESFRQLREILAKKAGEGVQVRLMYDDIGSIAKSNWHLIRELAREGIQCQVFNPALPFLNLFLNNRDHRKITVIDGKVGYTGGFNLADEYFGLTEPYGHWKDLGLRLEGRAVRSLTAIFLELWDSARREMEDPAPYLQPEYARKGDCYVQPFGDSPLDQEQTAENVYLNLIGHAKKYVWFMTPYLIITEELDRALELAAKRGVDVRIMTPGIPDQKIVHAVTRSYYAGLVRSGVRIFEYTPGFCHGKLCVCDGEMASIGTSNLDFRSLYLHFENNVLLYGGDGVKQMEADLAQTFSQCREVTDAYRSTILRVWQCVLRLFAPLM